MDKVSTSDNIRYSQAFSLTPLRPLFEVTHIVSLHYFELAKAFIFEGERHDFWEFLYVDKGEIEVMADQTGYNLKQGDLIFHQPNEFHSVWANQVTAPNVVVVCFVCCSEEMDYFKNKLICLDDYDRNLIAQIVKHGFAAYYPPFDNPRVHDLILREDRPLVAEQMIKLNLEQLLLSIRAKDDVVPSGFRQSFAAKERSEDELVSRAIWLMQNELGGDLKLEKIVRELRIGQTRLVTLFKEKTGMSVMKYFKTLKLDRARQLIREEKYNFTEIAELLGYSSIHAFSRHFKHDTGMTPSDYARSVQARV